MVRVIESRLNVGGDDMRWGDDGRRFYLWCGGVIGRGGGGVVDVFGGIGVFFAVGVGHGRCEGGGGSGGVFGR